MKTFVEHCRAILESPVKIILYKNYLYKFKIAVDLISRATFLGFANRTLRTPALKANDIVEYHQCSVRQRSIVTYANAFLNIHRKKTARSIDINVTSSDLLNTYYVLRIALI